MHVAVTAREGFCLRMQPIRPVARAVLCRVAPMSMPRCPSCEGFLPCTEGTPGPAQCPHCDRALDAKVFDSWWGRTAASAVMAVTLMACYGGYGDDLYDDCTSDPSICQDGGTADENCFDGVDNDLDGAIDCDDPSCAESCSTAPTCPVSRTIETGAPVELRFSGTSDDVAGTCVGAGHDDLRYTFVPGQKESGLPGTLRVTWSANGPVGAHVRGECADAASELACATAAPSGVLPISMPSGATPLTLAFEAVPLDTSETSATSVTVELEYVVAQCGNGERETSEQCDDGNDVAGDGCSPFCFIEPNYYCAAATPLAVGSHEGDTTDGSHAFSGPECAGPERLYAFTPAADGTLALALTSSANLRLATFTTCHADAFVNQTCAALITPLQVAATAQQPVYVVVAGADEGDAGAFTLDVAFTPTP